MFTERFRSALASTCTSLLLAGAAWAQAPAGPAERAVELELELARSRELYLVLDPSGRRLEVRARGMVLDSVGLVDVAVQALVPLVEVGAAPELEMPVLWHVTQAPEDMWRRVIAPPTLRPYTEEEEEEPTPGPGPSPTPAPSPTPVEIPADYDIKVDSGWHLEVTTRETPGFWTRLAEAIASGWARLRGEVPPNEPPRLLLVLSTEDARRIRHLFVPGAAILLAPTGSGAARLETVDGS